MTENVLIFLEVSKEKIVLKYETDFIILWDMCPMFT